MLFRVAFFALSAAIPLLTESAADEQITLVIPGIQCPMCVERLTTSLNKLDPSVKVGAIGTETKQMPVSYDPAKVTLHMLTQTVAVTPPVHNRSYEAGVLVAVDDLAKNSAKLKRALGQVKGVSNYFAAPGATPESGEIVVTLRLLPRSAKPSDQVKATQIAEALEKSGLEFEGLPDGSPAGSGETVDSKKKSMPAKGTARSKSGADEPGGEKTKSARPTPPAPRARPPRESAGPGTRPKDSEGEEKPRFEILAEAGGKIYLVDHESRNDEGKELKKFVKVGDTFGDYIVKESGDDDGLFLVLEHGETKETIRVQREKKDKGKAKSGEKPKEPAGKDGIPQEKKGE